MNESNEINEIEAQLRSWNLRQPSPRVERKLFRRRRADTPRPVVTFGWFAPVTAALLLACMVFNQHTGPAAAHATNGPLVAMIMSNQSSAPYLPGSFQSGQNIITANTFEWTNGSRSSSSMRSLSTVKGSKNQ